MKITSIRTRITLWNVLVLASVLGVLGVTLRYRVQANLIGGVDRELTGRSRRMASRWMSEGDRRDGPRFRGRGERGSFPPDGPPPGSPERGRPDGGRDAPPFPPKFLSRAGKDLRSGNPEEPWDPGALARSAAGEDVYSTVHREDQWLRVYSLPLRRDGKVQGVLQSVQPLADVREELNRLTRTLLTLIPLALFTAGAGGAFLTRRALGPVHDIAQAAEQIGAENLSGRLPVTGKDEFAELAVTFNNMLGRLEEAFTHLAAAFEQQQRFTADASHELRTPLTIILGTTSLTLRSDRSPAQYRDALQAVDGAARTMNRIVQDLLLLARSDADQLELDLHPIPVRDLLAEAANALRSRESASVAVDVPYDLRVVGDAHQLSRLLTNLLENALRHTPPEGRITLGARGEEGRVVVTVEDTGEGIPPEHLPHVEERFYRVDAARTHHGRGGTGLGLSICRSIVEAHRGTLVIDSVVGEGTVVRVTLPRAPAALADEPLPTPELSPGV